MSWSFSAIGKPDNLIEAIEKESIRLSGYLKIEFDDAKPHLIGLIRQNFNIRDSIGPPTLFIEASGHGCARTGPNGEIEQHLDRCCIVNIKSSNTRLV